MIIEELFRLVSNFWIGWQIELHFLPALTTLSMVVLCAFLLLATYKILTGPVSRVVNRIVDKTETETDDILLSPAIVKAICMALTVALAAYFFPRMTYYYPSAKHPVTLAARVLLIIAFSRVLILEATAFCVYLRHGDNQKSGVLVLRNVLTTIIYAISALLIISTILDRELAYVISALGAMAAVLMLVFKDSILGMIAGIRLTVNGMLHENDWVSVPAYNADGRVEDVSLTAVKIRNWDKSVATVPPYALVSGGFVNRQSMLALGVRQVKRAIDVDASTVRRLTPEDILKIQEEIGADFDLMGTDAPPINISLFRRYLRHTLLTHPRRAHTSDNHPLQVHVRELQPTPEGIPLEIFMFVDCLDWEEFEELQGDIVDRAIATLPIFRLRMYQKPSGADLARQQIEVVNIQ